MGRLEDENRPKLSHPTHAPLSWFPGGARQKRGELTRNREGEIYNSDKIKIQKKKKAASARAFLWRASSDLVMPTARQTWPKDGPNLTATTRSWPLFCPIRLSCDVQLRLSMQALRCESLKCR